MLLPFIPSSPPLTLSLSPSSSPTVYSYRQKDILERDARKERRRNTRDEKSKERSESCILLLQKVIRFRGSKRDPRV